jgi:hypothetical protein
VAKVEFHAGELFPRLGFIVTNLETPSRAVVRFYNSMSRKRLMYSVGTGPPEEKSDLCSLDRIRGGNEANEVDQQSHPLGW